MMGAFSLNSSRLHRLSRLAQLLRRANVLERRDVILEPYNVTDQLGNAVAALGLVLAPALRFARPHDVQTAIAAELAAAPRVSETVADVVSFHAALPFPYQGGTPSSRTVASIFGQLFASMHRLSRRRSSSVSS
jgi:hypothetical protein